MIQNPYAASVLYAALLKAQGTVNNALYEIWPTLNSEERALSTTAIGAIFAETITSGMAPLEREHPGLALPEKTLSRPDFSA